jgi:large subunit ribosomal protein L17
VNSLFEHGRVQTTVPKAKEARRVAERAITLGKKAVAADKPEQKLHFRRQAMALLHDRKAVDRLVDEVAPRYKDRAGGYTRIYKAGFRLGDRAAKAILQLV